MQVICLTSNLYAHMVAPFAYLFRKFWSETLPVTIVRYDVRAPRVGGNFDQTSVGLQKDYTWSSGLHSWLANHGPDIFILMLEDYWLSEYVKQADVDLAWTYLVEHPQVGKIDLSRDLLKREHQSYTTVDDMHLIEAGVDTQFQTSIQAAIWRRDFLLRWLKMDENAWQFEKSGTRRLKQARQAGDCDKLILGVRPTVLRYINACGGEGLYPGEYDHRKIPGWMWQELMAEGLVR